ncbi:lantibiotic dehydratase family protein [Chryseobacterium gleum]|uniref:lantibiotic dehydratase family protein n=1 Tax=Chryseobacterium gleum TaxID=250 RepID=UPI0031E13401
MSRFPYYHFEKYIVRTPLFSCKEFQEIASKDEISDRVLKGIYCNPVFQEAIYLASPYLHGELKKWIHSEKTFTSKELQKLKNSLLKYYSRMSTRSIPFGLFTEVGLGRFANEYLTLTKDDQRTTRSLLRDTKLDMHFLVNLSNHFVKLPEIKNRLVFYPNNNIYKIRNRIRYIEYEYTSIKRDYIISSALLSEDLQNVLEYSQHGKTIDEIAEILINEEITKAEAVDFLNELINNQILVSELEPNVSENDFFELIISVLQRINAQKEVGILISIKSQLDELDQNIGNPITLYSKLENLIKSLNTEYEQKYLFQTDLYKEDELILPSRWKKELKTAISFLNKITLSHKETHFSMFKKAFYERFERQEIPLSYALDTELGIGYGQNKANQGLHPYLEDLEFSLSQENDNIKIELDPFQQVINDKIQQALLYNQTIIELFDDDFKNFNESWDDLPETISFMAEIVSENNEEKLFLNGGGGSSAANLLARFCSEKSEVRNLVQAIVRKEEIFQQAQYTNNKILAEVIHLPEARIGNVIRRPSLRQYEIPYLAKSVLPEEQQILIDDLFISLKNDRIVLRSKKLNKEVKPYLTNAHNYSVNSLPVYHFLCDLYSQNIRPGLYVNCGDLKNIYQFLPRIEYKNIILSKAWWRVTEKELSRLSIFIYDETVQKEKLLSEIRSWRKQRQIPQWIQWVQSDNKLTINLENYNLVIIFIDTIKKLKSITIEEFLYNENDDLKREFIFPMYKLK